MGREIRRVPANWEHPKNERGYKPLFDSPYIEAINEWIKAHKLWEKGKHPDQLDGSGKEYEYYAQWSGDPPDIDYYRPNWKSEDATWFQMYETVSEGTPVTPPFATADELVNYLCNHGTFWDSNPWPRRRAEGFVKAGWAPSLISTPETGVIRGVEMFDK